MQAEEPQEQQAPQVHKALLVPPEQLVQVVVQDQMVLLVPLEQMAQMEQPEPQAQVVVLAQMEPQVPLEQTEQMEQLVPLDPQAAEPLEPLAQWVIDILPQVLPAWPLAQEPKH